MHELNFDHDHRAEYLDEHINNDRGRDDNFDIELGRSYYCECGRRFNDQYDRDECEESHQ